MKINVSMEFETVDDLLAFYEKLRTDDPVDHVDLQGIAKGSDPEVLPQEEPQAEPVVTEEVPAEPEQVVSASVHSRDEVKAYCTTARVEKGVKIKDLLLNLGVSSFKDLPDDKLDALYDAVKAARGD